MAVGATNALAGRLLSRRGEGIECPKQPLANLNYGRKVANHLGMNIHWYRSFPIRVHHQRLKHACASLCISQLKIAVMSALRHRSRHFILKLREVGLSNRVQASRRDIQRHPMGECVPIAFEVAKPVVEGREIILKVLWQG